MPRVRLHPEGEANLRPPARFEPEPVHEHAAPVAYVVERRLVLDDRDAELLQHLAQKWRITNDAALRRAIFAAAVAAGITGREVKPR